MKVKIIYHQDLSGAEKQINEFLKKEDVKELGALNLIPVSKMMLRDTHL
jgi:hypothetical protein